MLINIEDLVEFQYVKVEIIPLGEMTGQVTRIEKRDTVYKLTIKNSIEGSMYAFIKYGDKIIVT